MSGGWPALPVSVLTPVLPGRLPELEAALTVFDEAAPFARCAGTHTATWVLLAGPASPTGGDHLLLTTRANGPFEAVVEELRTVVGDDLDAVWRHCAGYPGTSDADPFSRYVERHRLDVGQQFTAYDASVPEVHRSLDLRRRHIGLAVRSQRMTPAELLAAFREEFGGQAP